MPVTAKPLDELCREGQLIKSSQGRDVYAVTYEGIRAPMIVKHLSIPATQSMVSGLIFSGAVADEEAALAYYSTEMDELKKELALLDQMRDHPHFLPYLDSQIKLKDDGIGYDVYLLTLRATTVRELMEERAFTSRSNTRSSVSVTQALCALRLHGMLHRNIKPENLYRDPQGVFRMGDLGVIMLDDIPFATLPDRYISECTAPELCDVLGMHNETVDTYSIGVVLWTIFNGYVPFDETRRRAGEALPAPAYAPDLLAEVLCKACAPASEDRYPTPSELLTALEGCIDLTDDTAVPYTSVETAPPAEKAPALNAVTPDLTPETGEEASEDVSASEPAKEATAEDSAEDAAAEDADEDEEDAEAPAVESPTEPPAEDTPAENSSAQASPAEVTIFDGATLPHIDLPQERPEISAKSRSAFAAAYEEEDDLSDVLTANPSRVKIRSRLWLKIAIPVLIAVLLAVAGFGVWNYLENRSYLIEQLTLEIQGADTMRVSITAPSDAPLTVNLADSRL